MKILAIETATEVCGIAYFENDAMQGLEEKRIPREHAKSLPMFYKSLQEKKHFKFQNALKSQIFNILCSNRRTELQIIIRSV